MTPPRGISPDLTVRQAVLACPACALLLQEIPGTRWDERWSLQELGALARERGWDERQFVGKLAAAAGVPVQARGKPPGDRPPTMLLFAALAVCLSLGAGWGVVLLLRIAGGARYAAASPASVHVHGVAQLWGWMALFIFAVGSHLLRQNTKRPAPPWLERVAAGLIVAGLLLFFAGLAGHGGWLDVIGSGLLALAAGLFSVSVIRSLWGRGQKPLAWHRFVLAMMGWLWVWAAMDWALRWQDRGGAVLPDGARNLLILLPVLGFATNAIYGFGMRLIPGLLNIGTQRPRGFTAALLLHNAGLGLLLTPIGALRSAGAGLMLAGAVSYLIGMNGLRGRPSREIFGIDPRGGLLIRAAFFWLVAGLAMVLAGTLVPGLPHAYAGAWRHALTVGFITMMILGVGQRMAPVFMKEPLASIRLMRLSAALILFGSAGRVGLELATMGGWRWTFRLMGATGLLELTALLLFALNLAWTQRNRLHVYAPGEPLTPRTRVREAINVHPRLQQRLHELGITMFDAAPFIAPSMTFGALALATGRRPEALLREIGSAKGSASAENPSATAENPSHSDAL